MSWAITLYHKSFPSMVGDSELDEVDSPLLDQDLRTKVQQQLIDYGYKYTNAALTGAEYEKLVGAVRISVIVFKTEVSFSVPYWPKSDDAIFTALQDATEIAECGPLIIHDPQGQGWLEP